MNKHICIHWEGALLFKPANPCKSGINVHRFLKANNTIIANSPCLKGCESATRCDNYQAFTAEQLAEKEQKTIAFLERMARLRPLINKLKTANQKGGQGCTDCPECAGKLQWTISSHNQHISLLCNTDGCVFMME
jgi:hypothetical protein